MIIKKLSLMVFCLSFLNLSYATESQALVPIVSGHSELSNESLDKIGTIVSKVQPGWLSYVFNTKNFIGATFIGSCIVFYCRTFASSQDIRDSHERLAKHQEVVFNAACEKISKNLKDQVDTLGAVHEDSIKKVDFKVDELVQLFDKNSEKNLQSLLAQEFKLATLHDLAIKTSSDQELVLNILKNDNPYKKCLGSTEKYLNVLEKKIPDFQMNWDAIQATNKKTINNHFKQMEIAEDKRQKELCLAIHSLKKQSSQKLLLN